VVSNIAMYSLLDCEGKLRSSRGYTNLIRGCRLYDGLSTFTDKHAFAVFVISVIGSISESIVFEEYFYPKSELHITSCRIRWQRSVLYGGPYFRFNVGDYRLYKLLIVDELLHTTFTYRTFDVLSYAYRRTLSNEDTLVDADFIALYPQLLHK
jgi:hypothetical protein